MECKKKFDGIFYSVINGVNDMGEQLIFLKIWNGPKEILRGPEEIES
jgi:hypothetical protein